MENQEPDWGMGGLPWEWPEAIAFREADAARLRLLFSPISWDSRIWWRYGVAFERLIEECYTWHQHELRCVSVHVTV